jgi:ATP-dependent 26S proteasome regulatory subunit
MSTKQSVGWPPHSYLIAAAATCLNAAFLLFVPRQVAVPLPDVKGRAEILEYYLSDKPVAAGLDQLLLARQTSGFSGADLSNLVGGVTLLHVILLFAI